MRFSFNFGGEIKEMKVDMLYGPDYLRASSHNTVKGPGPNRYTLEMARYK